jgi:hypothetical protein
MSVVLIFAIMLYFLDIALVLFSIYSLDFQNWINEHRVFTIRSRSLLAYIPNTLILISILYNLARWFLIIKQLNGEKELVSRTFHTIIMSLTIIISILGLLEYSL